MIKKIEEKDIPVIKELLQKVTDKRNYLKIERLGGLTNHTYHVILDDTEQYIVRIPGEGTEKMIIRENERISTELACRLEIDARCLYFGDDGSKVTEYINNPITMSAESMKKREHIKEATEIFKKLHSCGVDTKIPFEVFDMAEEYEKIIIDYHVFMYDDYKITKQKVMDIKQQIDIACNTTKVPCHNDPLCENWVYGNERMFLIDWEYAGMNDKMWDLADISIEANYDKKLDTILLKEYFDQEPDALTWKHFYANKIYVDYLWTLWAKTRVPFDGQSMEDWATERYIRLKKNILEFNNL